MSAIDGSCGASPFAQQTYAQKAREAEEARSAHQLRSAPREPTEAILEVARERARVGEAPRAQPADGQPRRLGGYLDEYA